MIILKYFLLTLVFGCSALAGFMISRKFKNRVDELRCFKNILNIIESKIKFTYEPIGDIFLEISKMIKDKAIISEIFEKASKNMTDDDVDGSWRNALEDSKLYLNLNKEDIDILRSFGKLLREN